VDARSDLYSTGCLVYELLTGRPPFTGDSPVAIAYQHVRENPVPPSRIDPSLPPWADSIVLKAMAKSPADRYQSAAEMNADIQRAASGMQVAAAMQPTRADYYPQRTQQMGPQTMMGAAPTTVSPYQQTGYQTGYQQPYGFGNGGPDGGGDLEQRGGARRWLPWVISGLVVVAAIIVAVVLLHGGGGGASASVPLVNGQTWKSAEAQIKAAGLVPVEHQQASSTVQSGRVISTSPDNGNNVAKGGTVTVNVSTGAGKISLPSFTGQQATAAEQTLKGLGFTNVNPVPDAQSTLPSGQVDHQTPQPGSYAPDQQITLYVSGGGTPVPNVVNQTTVEAQTILQQDGFNVNTVQTAAPSSQMVEPGTVYNQNPGANSVEPKGTTITIFVQPTTTTTTTPTDTPTDTTTPTSTPTDTTTPTSTPTDTGTPAPGNGGGGGAGNGGGLSSQGTNATP
jgi:beta-lactam-binding protein with PASTA domain